MTKKTLIESIASSLNCRQSEALKFVDTYHSIMIEEISHHHKFVIHGIGTFKLTTRKERQGRNPRTGETLTIPERKAINFKAAAPLLDMLNKEA